ncbi:hypothetical protein D3C85_1084400 [compost metagenome]
MIADNIDRILQCCVPCQAIRERPVIAKNIRRDNLYMAQSVIIECRSENINDIIPSFLRCTIEALVLIAAYIVNI